MQDLLLQIDNKTDLNDLLSLTFDYILQHTKDLSKLKKSRKLQALSADKLLFNVKYIENSIQPYCLNEISESDVKSNFSHLSTELQESLLYTLNARQLEITDMLTRELNCKENPLLKSFDWDVKWITGNSSLSTYRCQLATLILNCINKNGSSEVINCELNLSQVNNLIKILEDGNKELNCQ